MTTPTIHTITPTDLDPITVIEDHAHRQRHALTHSTCSVATGLGAIVVALLFGAWAAMQL